MNTTPFGSRAAVVILHDACGNDTQSGGTWRGDVPGLLCIACPECPEGRRHIVPAGSVNPSTRRVRLTCPCGFDREVELAQPTGGSADKTLRGGLDPTSEGGGA